MKRNCLFICFLMLITITMQAQKLTVESMTLADNDISASKYERKDLNGQACALMKVQMMDEISKVEGNVIGDVISHGTEKWVYLTGGSKEMKIIPKNHLPLHIIFANYDIQKTEAKTTYILVINETYDLTSASPKKTIPSQAIETYTVNGVSFNMIRVEGSSFLMGSSDGDAEIDEKPVHQVTLSDYYIGETEVTQELWLAVMKDNPAMFIDKKKPIEKVSWEECIEFILNLNELTGKEFRLPTEAEWEFAARGGKEGKKFEYSGGNSINDVAWYDRNAYKKGEYNPDYGTHAVKTKQPNELGIYDMSGNVYEWCSDWKEWYSGSPLTDPKGPLNGKHRVVRGGSWGHKATYCRNTDRSQEAQNTRSQYIGLRLAL